MTHAIETLANLFILHMFRTARTVRITGVAGSSLDDALAIVFPNAGPEWLATADPDFDAVNWPRNEVSSAIHMLYSHMLHNRTESAESVRYASRRGDIDGSILELAEALEDNAGIDARSFAYHAKCALLSGPVGTELRIVAARRAAQMDLGL